MANRLAFAAKPVHHNQKSTTRVNGEFVETRARTVRRTIRIRRGNHRENFARLPANTMEEIQREDDDSELPVYQAYERERQSQQAF